MRNKPGVLTPQELAIMKVVWQLEQVTVRDVYEAFREERPIAYTTVMTMMKVLETKGHLTRVRVKRAAGGTRAPKADRAHAYRPARPRQQTVAAMVKEFVNRVFDGAAQPLMLQLAKSEKLSAAERAELRRLIERKDDHS